MVRHVERMVGEEWEKAEQRLMHRDGCVIDVLVIKVKDIGAPEWAGRRSFYFDIMPGWKATYGGS